MSMDKPGHTGDNTSVKLSIVFSIGLKTKLIENYTNSL